MGLAHAALDLLIDHERGVWHLANEGEVTWADLAGIVARTVGASAHPIEPVTLAELGVTAPRAPYSPLRSGRGWVMPPIDDAIARFAREAA